MQSMQMNKRDYYGTEKKVITTVVLLYLAVGDCFCDPVLQARGAEVLQRRGFL